MKNFSDIPGKTRAFRKNFLTASSAGDMLSKEIRQKYSELKIPGRFKKMEKRMKLSTKGRYGLRALIDIAEYGEKDAVSIMSISERQHISESYLEQLIRKLKMAGLIKSIRGAGGGYQLKKDAAAISVGEVLKALEGDIEPVSCGGFREDETCEVADACVTKYVWKRLNETIEDTLNSIMLSELVEDSRKMHKSLMERTVQNAKK